MQHNVFLHLLIILWRCNFLFHIPISLTCSLFCLTGKWHRNNRCWGEGGVISLQPIVHVGVHAGGWVTQREEQKTLAKSPGMERWACMGTLKWQPERLHLVAPVVTVDNSKHSLTQQVTAFSGAAMVNSQDLTSLRTQREFVDITVRWKWKLLLLTVAVSACSVASSRISDLFDVEECRNLPF